MVASELGAIFAESVAVLFDSTCLVTRESGRTPNNRFGGTVARASIYDAVPCTVQHATGGETLYADRLAGRVLVNIFVPRTYVVLYDDLVKVHGGGDTYEVIGPPHSDGPDDPCLQVPCAAVSPVVTNA